MRQRAAGLNREVVDPLIQRIGVRFCVGGVPLNAFLRQQVVPTKGAQANRAVAVVGDRCLRHRQCVEVDNVIEHAHFDVDQALQNIVFHQIRFSRNGTPQIDRRQVAYHKVAGLFGNHDLVAADHLLNEAGRAHILQNLSAQIAGIDHPLVLIRVHPVNFVAVEHKGVAGFQLADHDALKDIDRLHNAAADRFICHQLFILTAKRTFAFALIKKVLQVPAFLLFHLVWVKQIPITATLDHLHKEIRNTDGGEHIVRAQTLVAVIQAQIKKHLDIFVEDIEVDRHGAFALAQLVDADGRIVELFDPRHHAAAGAFHPADIRSRGAHIAKIGPHAAAVFGHPRDVSVAVINPLKAVINRINETAGQLTANLAGIRQRRSGHGHVKIGQRPIGFLDQHHTTIARLLVLHQIQRNRQPTLLRQLVNTAGGVCR